MVGGVEAGGPDGQRISFRCQGFGIGKTGSQCVGDAGDDAVFRLVVTHIDEGRGLREAGPEIGIAGFPRHPFGKEPQGEECVFRPQALAVQLRLGIVDVGRNEAAGDAADDVRADAGEIFGEDVKIHQRVGRRNAPQA